MKKLLILSFSFFVLSCTFFTNIHAQERDCSNHNAFLKDKKIYGELSDKARHISPREGVIGFDKSNVNNEINNFESFRKYFNLNDDYNFKLVRSTESRFNKDIKYVKYREYYKGIEVCGSSFITTDGPDNPDPCSRESFNSVFVSTSIYSDINIDTRPKIEEEDLIKIMDRDIDKEKLIICHDSETCSYKLLWELEIYDGTRQKIKIDANTGKIVSKEPYSLLNISDNKTDFNYFTKNEKTNATNLGGEENISISTDVDCGEFDIDGGDWSTLPTVCPITAIETPFEFEAQNSIQEVLGFFETLGIGFNNIHIGLGGGCLSLGLYSRTSDIDDTVYIFLNQNLIVDENGVIDPEVLAHELAHAFLIQFFDKLGTLDENGESSRILHEGLAMIFGIYIESLAQGGVFDWVGADDTEAFADGWIDQQFWTEPVNCMQLISQTTGHEKGQFLGFWLFTMINGNEELEIPQHDPLMVMNLIIDAVSMLDDENIHINDFVGAIFRVIDQNFDDGYCSEFGQSVYSAFSQFLCEGFGSWDLVRYDCERIDFTVNSDYGDNGGFAIGENVIKVCEESGTVCLELNGDNTEYHRFRWNYPHGWIPTNNFGMPLPTYSDIFDTNNVCFEFTEQPYYPRNYSICVRNMSAPTVTNDCIKIVLVDCDGDDPTCEEYYSSNGLMMDDDIIELNKNRSQEDLSSTIRIYDLFGRLVHKGNIDSLNEYTRNKYRNTVLVRVEYDSEGQVINSEKIFNTVGY